MGREQHESSAALIAVVMMATLVVVAVLLVGGGFAYFSFTRARMAEQLARAEAARAMEMAQLAEVQRRNAEAAQLKQNAESGNSPGETATSATAEAETKLPLQTGSVVQLRANNQWYEAEIVEQRDDGTTVIRWKTSPNE